MPKNVGTVTVEVEIGPQLQLCMEILVLTREIIDRMPWDADRDQLRTRLLRLLDEVQEMRTRTHGS
jgi:hypothetical protein